MRYKETDEDRGETVWRQRVLSASQGAQRWPANHSKLEEKPATDFRPQASGGTHAADTGSRAPHLQAGRQCISVGRCHPIGGPRTLIQGEHLHTMQLILYQL